MAEKRDDRVRSAIGFLLLAVVLIVALPARAQNLVQDPGFETATVCTLGCTSAPPWIFVPSAAVNNFGFIGHTGTNALQLATGPGAAFAGGTGPGSASQVITIQRAGTYTFSFWEKTFLGASFQLTAGVGSNTILNGTVNNSTYVQQSANVSLSAGSNVIQFSSAYLSGNTGSAMWIDDVSLVLIRQNLLTPLLPQGAPVNAINVAAGIDSFVNNGGLFPGTFQQLSSLSGQPLVNALIQLDGENSTNAERGAFELMNEFMGLMIDPFVDGRFGAGSSSFAPDRPDLPPEIAMAYASILKAPPKQLLDNRWSIWGTGFGGSNHADGNANVGSTNASTSTYGFASGADYHFTRDTLVGFALAGAGTNWSLTQGLGSGRSDAFLAGVYGKTAFGPVYVAADLAYGENWFTTNRAALGDQLTAKFAGESFGGRLESGYRFAIPSNLGQFELAPYAAIQAQSFRTPNYSETDLTGGGLGLNFNSMTATDTRSELGMRFADMTAVDGMPLIFRTKLAWAHDWVDNPALNATFQSLPGSSFVVNGAPVPSDSALVSVGAELHMSTHWSAIAKFDGEFASNSQTYAGTGTLRYKW
jgi:hypothetical protein